MTFYHGSSHKFKKDDLLLPFNYYTSRKEVEELERLFEEERPKTCIYPRIDCVYLTDSIEDLEYVGCEDGYTYLVDIEDGECERSDLSWYTKAGIQLEEGDIKGARESAKKYWSGEVFEKINESLFEYRIDLCYIVKSI